MRQINFDYIIRKTYFIGAFYVAQTIHSIQSPIIDEQKPASQREGSVNVLPLIFSETLNIKNGKVWL